MIRFGPSGNGRRFYEDGNKSSVEMPAWLKKIGLDAYEYSCTKGVNIGEATARAIGEEGARNDIFISIHAPYYINLSSTERDKRENSRGYILQTLVAARWMGARRVVVHTGAASKLDRGWALETASRELEEVIREADNMGLSDIAICPEVLGKKNQLGTLDEILAMCKMDERLIPTIDFGHVHARDLGALNSIEDFDRVLVKIENELGYERLKHLHAHFSRIEYTSGGEKKHWTLDDRQFGPDFEHLAVLLHQKRLEPVIICESAEKMAEDALTMKNIYDKIGESH